MKKDHWFPFFPRDFYADGPVILMTADAESCYLRLLAYQWLNGSIPATVTEAARICPKVTPARFRKLWPSLSPCFPVTCEDGRRQNGKLERIREERRAFLAKKSDAGKRGNDVRWKHRTPIANASQNDRKSTAEGIANASPPLPSPLRDGSAREDSLGDAAPPSGGSVPTPINKPARRAQAFRRAAEEADAFREVALAPPAPGERP